MRWRKEIRGSYTVEMAVIMPVVILILILSITMSLFLYDKCILTGAVMEAAVSASEQIRCEDSALSSLVRKGESVAGKRIIFFAGVKMTLSEEKDRVVVSGQASKAFRRLQCSVSASACTVKPENYIRIYKAMSEKQED